MILTLAKNSLVNKKIISIFNRTSKDPFLGSTNVCNLNGANNIQIEVFGHHQILSDSKLINVVLKILSDC